MPNRQLILSFNVLSVAVDMKFKKKSPVLKRKNMADLDISNDMTLTTEIYIFILMIFIAMINDSKSWTQKD